MDFSSNSTPRQLVPAGMHTAILYSIIDLGKQEIKMEGKPSTFKRKVRFTWELPEEKSDEGKPLVIGKEYTQSSHEKATIVKDVKAWTGEAITSGFNPKSLLGKACNLTVSHDTKGDSTYANIMGIAPLKKGEVAPPLTNALVYFDLDEFSINTFNDMPEFLQNKIKLSPEYVEAINKMNNPDQYTPANAGNVLEGDSVPF